MNSLDEDTLELELPEDFFRDAHRAQDELAPRTVTDPLCTCAQGNHSPAMLDCPAGQPVRSTGHVARSTTKSYLTCEPAVSREELIEFIRQIAEGESPVASRLVQGQRAIELAAWEFYRRLQNSGEL